ncbi:MAG: response regulator [Acidobacteria bacterium]|nr:response regulator [Acidobacteriota bacterium]
MSNHNTKEVVIMMADDDEDDRLLVKEAFEENRLANPLKTVEDGEQLMHYLNRENGYEDAARPGLILLDLNMPKKSGFEALEEIKADPSLRQIPVIILTTSKAEEDIVRSYDLGVNSFIVKPVTFDALVETVRELGKYWFNIVELPAGR